MKWDVRSLVTHDTLDKARASVRLNIDAPPCTSCKHWRPVVNMDKRGEDWVCVTLCHAKEMFADFSCHTTKPEWT